MSEQQRNGKTFAQDALGFLFCGIGAFFAVSIVLFLNGGEPKPGFVRVVTSPVIGLVAELGAPAALCFSLGLAALGTLLFLRTSAFAALRPLLALTAGTLGLALVLGAFGHGGTLGAWLPGLVDGVAGRALAVVLGLALAWLGWTIVPAQRRPAGSAAEAMQRIGLNVRHDSAGVSPAEAALLGSDSRAPSARPTPRRPEAAPARDESIRPIVAASASVKPIPAEVARPPRAATPLRTEPATRIEPVTRIEPAKALTVPLEPPVAEEPTLFAPPPAPSWEAPADAFVPSADEELEEERDQGQDDEQDEEFFEPALRAAPAAPVPFEADGERERELAALLPEPGAEDDDLEAELEAELAREEEHATVESRLQETLEEELEEELEEDLDEDLAPAPAVPGASWEQIGLFDAEEPAEEPEEPALEEPPPVKAKVETPTFDFEPLQPRKPAHEPEPAEQDPFAGAPMLAPTPAPALAAEGQDEPDLQFEEELEEEELTPVAPVRPAPARKEQPGQAAQAAPGARDLEGERWSQLLFDAGCAILEQKRVAVSMLERRFGIDFDQACKVLDELQQAGLIGPYMGGRTRDILLTREEWLSHAPHAS
jgi:hypothetical protein